MRVCELGKVQQRRELLDVWVSAPAPRGGDAGGRVGPALSSGCRTHKHAGGAGWYRGRCVRAFPLDSRPVAESRAVLSTGASTAKPHPGTLTLADPVREAKRFTRP